MNNHSPFSQIETGLEAEFEAISRLEPIFHNVEFGASAEEFESRMSADYWEVGASGRRYSRAFILDQAEKIASANAENAGWRSSEFGLRKLGSGTFLLTYTLDQNGRLTRRATIWQKSADGWQILYHQGTILNDDHDNSVPEYAQISG
jgi:hypothetical protein